MACGCRYHSHMNRIVAVALIGTTITAIAGYAAYWHIGANAVERLVEERFAAERARGLTIAHAPTQRGGFPGHVRLSIADLDIADPAGGWAFHIPDMVIEVAPWRPLRQELSLVGPIQGSVPGARAGDTLNIGIEAATLAGSLVLQADGRAETANLHARDLLVTATGQIAPPGPVAIDAVDIDLSQPAGQLDQQSAAPAPVLEAVLGLKGIVVEGADLVLGPRVERIGLRAVLKGDLQHGGTPRQSLAAWRDAGGVIDMPWIALTWGALGLNGNGAVALDEAMRPLGTIALSISGFRETITHLAEGGVIDRRSAGAMSLAMSLFARTPPGGGPQVIDTALRMQDGEIALGPFRLGTLPPVVADAAGARADTALAVNPETNGPVAPPPVVEHLTRPVAPPPQLPSDWAPASGPAPDPVPAD